MINSVKDIIFPIEVNSSLELEKCKYYGETLSQYILGANVSDKMAGTYEQFLTIHMGSNRLKRVAPTITGTGTNTVYFVNTSFAEASDSYGQNTLNTSLLDGKLKVILTGTKPTNYLKFRQVDSSNAIWLDAEIYPS